MHNAAAQFLRGGADRVDRPDDICHPRIDMVRAAIGQFAFGQRPDPFVGIEFRGVGGKMFDGETGVSAEQVVERFPVVSGGIIPQNDHRTTPRPQ